MLYMACIDRKLYDERRICTSTTVAMQLFWYPSNIYCHDCQVRSCCIWLVLIGSYTIKDEYVPVLQLLCNYFGILSISIAS